MEDCEKKVIEEAEALTAYFYFNGRRLPYRRGDTAASALLRNGVRVVGRSFKFHRPRGVMSAGLEEPNALLSVLRGQVLEPNVRATTLTIQPDMRIFSQNHWPSLRLDLAYLFNLFRRFMPAAFYYKTFMWPRWSLWEPLVRRLAGLGKAPAVQGEWRYGLRNLEADLVIVGAGSSGLRAAERALEATETGSVYLLEAKREVPAGAVDDDGDQRRALLRRLKKHPSFHLMCSTLVVARYDDEAVLAVQDRTEEHAGAPAEVLLRIRAEKLVLATGAIERPMVFPFNDRPGIMLASALCDYHTRFQIPFSEPVVFAGNNDSVWRAAQQFCDGGRAPSAVVDVRESVDDDLVAPLRNAGVAVLLGRKIRSTSGWWRLRAITVVPVSCADDGGGGTRIRCSWLGVSGGWTPTVHLYSQGGGKLVYDEGCAAVIPAEQNPQCDVVGRAAGEFSPPLKVQAWWATPGAPLRNQWIDHQYDVTASDIELAVNESFQSVEHVKRYTTNGMSLDQGKTSNMNGLGLLAQTLQRSIDAVGTTRYRPPYQPVSLGVIAAGGIGRSYSPFRLLPAHRVHKALGAQFEDHGGWFRPACYPRPGESESESIVREVRSVRTTVGVLDYSSLGKIEVCGRDAREFLDRVYVNNISSLQAGTARYGIMLREDGIVLDDGIVVCRSDEDFLLHTTSAGAPGVYAHLDEWLQCEWRDLQVGLSDVSSAWATFMVAGPGARQLMESLDIGVDFDAPLFPHMQWCDARFPDFPVRILRASFTGELSYEISVPAPYGESLMEHICLKGADLGITPFGVEALMTLRAEKGYLHPGVDTDGTTMPQDLGWGNAVKRKNRDFIGKRSLAMPVGTARGRFEFTGLQPLGGTSFQAGAHVIDDDTRETIGYVTSACFSPTLHSPIALGLVASAFGRQGEVVTIFDNGEQTRARLCSPCFVDPQGLKIHA